MRGNITRKNRQELPTHDGLHSLLSGALRFVTRTPVLGLALGSTVPSLVAKRTLLHGTTEVQHVTCA